MNSFEPSERYSICITTSRAPTSTSSNTSNSEAAQILCPHTGNAGMISHQGSNPNSSIMSSSSSSTTMALKTGAGMGIHSISPYYGKSSNNNDNITNHGLYLAYAGTSKENMYAMLLTSNQSPHVDIDNTHGNPDNNNSQNNSNALKWKCRLPEYMEAGLHISPHTPRYVIGGGKSGRAYIWSTFQNGALLNVWQAHYRPITTISYSSCGGFVLTGGSDGVVHLWNILDLVNVQQRQLNNDVDPNEINPLFTWSEHQLPITGLYSLPSNRAISISSDRQLIIMELFNGKTLARILLPSALTCVTADQNTHRLYVGAVNGAIYCVDLDTFAISTTAESATIVSQNNFQSSSHKQQQSSALGTSGTRLLESVLFGQHKEHQQPSASNTSSGSPTTLSSSYISELCGHERKVTALTLLEGGASNSSNSDGDETNTTTSMDNDLLVSGGEDGTVRVWDIRARCCTCVMRPWAATSTTGYDDDQTNRSVCPVSAIVAIPHMRMQQPSLLSSLKQSSGDLLGSLFSNTSTKHSSGCDVASMIRPLQRFKMQRQQQSLMQKQQQNSNNDGDLVSIIIPSVVTNQSSIQFWDDGASSSNIFREGGGGSHGANVEYEHVSKRYRLACSLNTGMAVLQPSLSSSSAFITNNTNSNPLLMNKDHQTILHDGNKNEEENKDGSIQIQEKESKLTKSENEINRLQKELDEANALIERWQKVNSKLAMKLKKFNATKTNKVLQE